MLPALCPFLPAAAEGLPENVHAITLQSTAISMCIVKSVHRTTKQIYKYMHTATRLLLVLTMCPVSFQVHLTALQNKLGTAQTALKRECLTKIHLLASMPLLPHLLQS